MTSSSETKKQFGEAPNVVVILLDDMGFGGSSAFGGPCEMPVADRLAAGGLRYNQFHTTAICTTSRAALLTGRNHHSVGWGHIEMRPEYPGYTGRMGKDAATIARMLRDNGYATGSFGKAHETPKSETTPVGPFDRWPTQLQGFEKFYGFVTASTNHWVPTLYDGTTPIVPERAGRPGYHLSEDLVDQAIGWISDVRAITPTRPFFCYLPFGAVHAPFHVPPGWADKYRGRFDQGWEVQREKTLARQKQMGIVPESTLLAPWAPTVEGWNDLTPEEQKASIALMELHAGFAEHTDAQVGRLIEYLQANGLMENTLVFYILGDNGASTEGGRIGSVTGYYSGLNGSQQTSEQVIADLPKINEAATWPHYARGWAIAMNTPFQWMKQVASHYGGTRNGLVVHWPRRITAQAGAVRSQWHHLIDITPTILAAAGIEQPEYVDGIRQKPIEGFDMSYSLEDGQAPSNHVTQYFEIGGSRSIYHDGWVAAAVHRPRPWDFQKSHAPPFEVEQWQLYDNRADFSQANDLADIYPEKVEDMKKLFMREAEKYNVLPLDDRSFSERRSGQDKAKKKKANSLVLTARASRIPTEALPPIYNSTHRLTSSVTVGASANGVICSLGGTISGWSLYCLDGVLTYCHSVGTHMRHYIRADRTLAAGPWEVSMLLRYHGPHLGGSAEVTLFVDGEQVGSGHLPATMAYTVPGGEDFTVGSDPQTPVSAEYALLDNHFTGTIGWVRIDSGESAVAT